MKFSIFRIFFGVSIFLAVASTAVTLLFKNFNETNVKNQEILKPEILEIVALGRLEPKGEIISVAGPLGERIARLEVTEGDFVKAGRILAYLESYEAQQRSRNLAASQVVEIKQRMQTDIKIRRSEIDLAQTQMTQIDKPQLLQIQSQQAVVQRLTAELLQAKKIRNRFEYLSNQGAISQQDFDTKQLALKQAQENLNQAQATLVQLIKARDADIKNAQMNVQRTQDALAQVYSYSGLQSAIENLALTEARLKQTMIRAPQNGQILKIFARPGEAIDNQGIVTLGDTRQMYAVAEVYETDINQVKPEQKAIITSPAFAKPLTGKVVQLGKLVFKNNIIGDDPTADTDTRVVEVKIRLDDSKLVSGLTNLQVKVAIQVNSLGDRDSAS